MHRRVPHIASHANKYGHVHNVYLSCVYDLPPLSLTVNVCLWGSLALYYSRGVASMCLSVPYTTSLIKRTIKETNIQVIRCCRDTVRVREGGRKGGTGLRINYSKEWKKKLVVVGGRANSLWCHRWCSVALGGLAICRVINKTFPSAAARLFFCAAQYAHSPLPSFAEILTVTMLFFSG